MHYKSLNESGFDLLQSNLAAYMATIPPLAPNGAVLTDSAGDKYKFKWSVTSVACPLYLLGRYRKLARDVPQSPWTVSMGHGKGGEEDEDEDEGGANTQNKQARVEGCLVDNEGSSSMAVDNVSAEGDKSTGSGASAKSAAVNNNNGIVYARKGRHSVEEIVNSVVKEHLQAADCRMHPCGREDIDVRCLGEENVF